MSDFESEGTGNNPEEPTYETIVSHLQVVQHKLRELEVVYPDVYEALEELRSRISAHETKMHELGDMAHAKMDSNEIDESTANVVARAIEDTIQRIAELKQEEEPLILLRMDLDLMITELTMTRQQLFNMVRPRPLNR